MYFKYVYINQKIYTSYRRNTGRVILIITFTGNNSLALVTLS